MQHTKEAQTRQVPKAWDFLAPPYRAIANPDPTGYTWQVACATPVTFELIAKGHVTRQSEARRMCLEKLEGLTYNFEQAKQIGGV